MSKIGVKELKVTDGKTFYGISIWREPLLSRDDMIGTFYGDTAEEARIILKDNYKSRLNYYQDILNELENLGI